MREHSDGVDRLTEKVAVVTGAGSGIWRSVAHALAREEARVVLIDRNADALDEPAAEIEHAGGECLAFRCDVSKEVEVEDTARDVRSRLGTADILVNNAGMIRAGGIAELGVADWDAVVGINLTGFFLCARAFGRQMREVGRGSIVNMASIASTFPTPFAGAYSVTKAGVSILSRQLAVEWGPAGVRSNAVCPSMILTELSRSMYESPGVEEARSATIPSRRIGRSEDTAEAVLFLASDRSAYVNGAEITVDGGVTRNLLSLIPRAGYEPQTAASTR